MRDLVGVLAALRRARVATRRCFRQQLRLHLLQFRKNWAATRGEYELVGGPLDGQVMKWDARTTFFVGDSLGGGAYRHESDYRMHYHVDAPSASSWQGCE